MLRLTIVEPSAQAGEATLAAYADVYIWRDIVGRPCAYGHTVGGLHWIHWPRLASYCFDGSGTEVIAVPTTSSREDAVVDTFHRMVLPLALQIRGREALHASAVMIGDGVVGFCATSGIGKSTLAYALDCFSACPQWSDDVLVFEVTSESIRAIPLPFSPRLAPEAAAAFRGTGSDRPATRPAQNRSETSADIVALCLLARRASRRGEAPGQIVHLSPKRAFPAVLAHAHCFSLLDAERKKRMIDHYLELVDRVPVFEISFEPGLEHLPSLALRVAEAFARGR
jgi:hypothetical protein